MAALVRGSCLVAVVWTLAVVGTARAEEGSEARCIGAYPKGIELIVDGKTELTGDRFLFTRLPGAERFVVKGRYGGRVLYPLAALVDRHPTAESIRIETCGPASVELNAKAIKAEPARYFFWYRKVQNGYLKLMDFGDMARDAAVRPLEGDFVPRGDDEYAGSAPKLERVFEGGGISGNPELVRNIHTVRVSVKTPSAAKD